MRIFLILILLFLMGCMTACSTAVAVNEAAPAASFDGEKQEAEAQPSEEEILPQNDLYKPVIDLLRIYDSVGTAGNVIKTVPFGETVPAEVTQNGYVALDVDGKTGYVREEYIVPEDTDILLLTYITNGSVNIRETASIENDKNIIAKLEKREIVRVVGELGDFYKVCTLDGTIGYSYKQYYDPIINSPLIGTYDVTAAGLDTFPSAEALAAGMNKTSLLNGELVYLVAAADTADRIVQQDGLPAFVLPEQFAALATETTDSKDALPYYIYVEKGSFTMTIYQKDDEGNYTEAIKTYRIAHGGNKTPTGLFEISSKQRWHEFLGNEFTQYASVYSEDGLYIHSPLYYGEDNTQLIQRYYNGSKGIGKATTGGCLRLVTEGAKWIFDHCPNGTVVEIVNGSPRGTTSSDIPKLIDEDVDPTDPNV